MKLWMTLVLAALEAASPPKPEPHRVLPFNDDLLILAPDEARVVDGRDR